MKVMWTTKTQYVGPVFGSSFVVKVQGAEQEIAYRNFRN